MCDIQLLSGHYSANQESHLPVISWGFQTQERLVLLLQAFGFYRKKSCFLRPEGDCLATQAGPCRWAELCQDPSSPGLFLSFADQG